MVKRMKKIVIVGSGGFAKEVKGMIDAINKDKPQWNLLGFIDDWGKQKGEEVIGGYKVVGTIDDLNNTKEELFVTIAMANPQYIKENVGKIHNPMIKYANLFHPAAEIISTDIGFGNIIGFCCTISCNITIGDFNIFNTGCNVGHDTKIGSFNVFSPQTQVSGNVSIGDGNYWGLNSSIVERKSVGNHNKIGAYTFVIRSIKDNGSYFGIPAKKQVY
jgi:sugar O-acyltransferase (sialic acid O-acetyltransferase NeuD family)